MPGIRPGRAGWWCCVRCIALYLSRSLGTRALCGRVCAASHLVLQLYVVEEVRTNGIYINCLCQYSSCTLDLELSVSRDS